MSNCVIWWIRRDMRLADNPALQAALDSGLPLMPLFIMDETLLKKAAPKRKAFLFNALHSLDGSLRERGSRLVLRSGRPLAVLHEITRAFTTAAIFACEDYSPYARRRDTAAANNFTLQLLPGVSIHHPAAVLKPDGSPYTVFTPYSRAWKRLSLPASFQKPPPQRFPEIPAVESRELPPQQALPEFPAAEEEAQRRLHAFLEGDIMHYHSGRDRLDWDATSLLSPYFRFGLLSVRRAAAAVMNRMSLQPPGMEKGCETWLNELMWRDFYISILYHFPYVLRNPFRTTLRNIEWLNAPGDMQAWQDGQSGYPVIDAAMRQLAGTGWMHNRARMLSASFLAKDLLINWQEGESWFMQHLVDGEPAANNGGWQWTAGSGSDAAPYFRIFNPVLQGKKFDPHGDYVRRWLPELHNVPLKYLHEPWRMPPAEQQRCGCLIGRHYPAPIIVHQQARQRSLAAYRSARRLSSQA